MKKSITLVVLSLFIGWIFRGFYVEKTTPVNNQKKELSNVKCEDSSPEVIEKIVNNELIKYVPQIKIVYKEKKENNSTTDPFFLALKKKKFYKAMEFYEEAEEEKYSLYQQALLAYFKQEQGSRPVEIMGQIRYFIEIESNNKTFIFLLAQLYKDKGDINKAIEILMEFSYLASGTDVSLFENKIKSLSISYIALLMKRNDYKNTIDFLQTQINTGMLSEFFSFELALVYLKLKKYSASKELLKELKEDEIYKEKAISLINYIDEKLAEKEEYPIQIPLLKSGLHFMVKAYVNQKEALLLLDTGASITTIDYDLVSDLEVVKTNVVFSTANGKIQSTIFNANKFTIGSITLNNFHIVGGIESGGAIKGLLGMNFLGKYKFKIDQKQGILFLGKKY